MSASLRWPQWALVAIIGLSMTFIALCFGIYASGERFVPDDIPASSYRAPDAIRDQYLAVEADGATSIRKLNPVTFWIDIFVSTRQFPEQPPPEQILLYRATRVAQFKHSRARTQGERHLASIALAVKVGRQWTRDEAVNTILAESGFRKDVIGIEAAADRHGFGERQRATFSAIAIY